jgi:hypothetical protein
MQPRAFILFLFLIVVCKLLQAQTGKAEAQKLIAKAESAMGEGWKSVKTLSLEGYGYQNMIDESERPEGPFIPIRVSRSILKDLDKQYFKATEATTFFGFDNNSTLLFNSNVVARKIGSQITPTLRGDELRMDLNLAPEMVLKTASAASDLKFVKDTVYQRAGHSLLFFTYHGYPVRVFLNQETDLLTAVEITCPDHEDFGGIWGDTKRTVIYSFWALLGKGIHYPMQQDAYVNGWYKSSFLFNKWELNPEINTDSLMIPDSVKEQCQGLMKHQEEQMANGLAKSEQIMPGVWFLPGFCNSTVIDQPDGVVVIEGTFSSQYGEAIINKALGLFPGKKIKALISTSDAWLHIGGVRSFAAIPGIAIYHPIRNEYILNKLLHANYITQPDVFAKTKKPSYTLIGVSDTMAIGSGNNRVVIYAYRTETGDRQMMVYFPHHKTLYTSDHYQPKGPDGKFWNEEIVDEVYHSIKQRGLDVKQFYAMHSAGLISFEDMANDAAKMDDQ